MATKTALVVVEGFSAFGKDYRIKDQIDPEDYGSWPDGTLQRRIENKFAAFRTIQVADTTPAAPSADENIAKMDKAELIDYALGAFALELDANMPLEAIRAAVLEAAHSAAR